MKKIFVMFFAVVYTVLLCSCGIPAQKRECFVIPENFTCKVFVTNENCKYEGILEKQDGKYSLKITSPESLCAMVTEYYDGEYKVKFSGSEMNLVPDSEFFLSQMITFTEDSYEKENIECVEEDGSYIIRQNNWELRF